MITIPIPEEDPAYYLVVNELLVRCTKELFMSTSKFFMVAVHKNCAYLYADTGHIAGYIEYNQDNYCKRSSTISIIKKEDKYRFNKSPKQ